MLRLRSFLAGFAMAPAIVAFVALAGSPALAARQVTKAHVGFVSSAATYDSLGPQVFVRTIEQDDVEDLE